MFDTWLDKRRAHKARIESDLGMIDPKQRKKDNSAHFKLVGGPYHDLVVRLYAPWEELVFPNGAHYELHPPIGNRSARWVYIHTPEVSGEKEESHD